MKVLFLYVSTNMCRDGRLWYYDEGVASVVSCLRRAGHGTAFRMVFAEDTLEEVASWVARHREEKTLLVFHISLLFSAFGHDFPETFPRVAKLKEVTGLPTAFLGLYATLNPEEVLSDPGVDFVGRGEVDEALVELCDALERGEPTDGIPNVWSGSNGGVRRNPLRPLIEDISALPFPARDLLPLETHANERDGILTLVATRGCPMGCEFCSNHVLRKLYEGKGKYARLKSADYVIREIQAARDSIPELRAVFFHDDIFGLSKEWAQEFFKRYPAEVGVPYGVNLVASQVTGEFVHALRSSGCRQVQVGIESGSPYVRNEVLKKGIDDADIHEAVQLLRNEGILVKFYAMMGLPKETRRRLRVSMRNLALFHPDMIQIQVWEPHAGSELLEARSEREADSPAAERESRRRRFFFRHFHRYIALYQTIEELRKTNPIRARLARLAVDCTVQLPWAPDVLEDRDMDDESGLPARVLFPRKIRDLASRLARPLIDASREREERLAADYIWPQDLADAPEGQGWRGRTRLDRRRTAAAEGE